MSRNATAEQLTMTRIAEAETSDRRPASQAEIVASSGAPLPAVQDQEPTSLMEVIARASRDPSVDVDKLERLLQMGERVQAREAETAFNAAMTAAQAEIRPIAADANNPQTRSKYASYLALDKALRPIYGRHGFSLSFDTGDSAPEFVKVLCYVSHSQGHSRTYRVEMPADGKGAKGGDVMTKTHATGAAITYGQRYLLKAIFNIAVGEDNDGGGDGDTITEVQLEQLQGMITKYNVDIEKFCAYMKISALMDLRAKDYARAVEAINMKRTKAGAK